MIVVPETQMLRLQILSIRAEDHPIVALLQKIFLSGLVSESNALRAIG